MSTSARKARKRAGVRFERTPKEGTPLQDRKWFVGVVQGAPGTRHSIENLPRSAKKRRLALTARGIESELLS